MLDCIRHFPAQLTRGWELAQALNLSGLSAIQKGRIVLAGMGGSSVPGDLINDYLQGAPYIHLVRDYRLPRGIGPGDIVLVCSFSGNTEETLSLLEEVRDRRVDAIVFSHAGSLGERARRFKLPHFQTPQAPQPRMAVGYVFAGILGVLERGGRIPPGQSRVLEHLSAFLESERPRHQQEGERLAAFLKDKMPLIYGPAELYGACRFWKIKFNENAKLPCFFNVFPELNHNEMVGFDGAPRGFAAVCLQSPDLHPRVRERMQITREMLEDLCPFYPLELRGDTPLKHIFDSLAVADYASFSLAQARGVDPVPVTAIERFKSRLGPYRDA